MKCLIEQGTLCVSEGVLGLFRPRREAEKVD